MIVETFAVVGTAIFLILLVKDWDLKYILAFIMSFFAAIAVETPGISSKAWYYNSIAWPFSYQFLGTPIGVCFLYGSLTAITILVFKSITKFRRKNPDFDNIVAYILLATGVILLVLREIIPVHEYLGMILIAAGAFLLVKDVVIVYVGLIMMFLDLIIEKFIIGANQLVYLPPHDMILTAIGYFLGGTILAAVLIGFDRYFAANKGTKKRPKSLSKV